MFTLIGRWLNLVSARLTKGGHQIEEGKEGCRRLLGNRGAMRLGRRNDPGRVSNHWHFTMKVAPIRLALEDLYGEGENGRGSMLEEKELWRVWEECTCAVSVHAILTVSRDMHLTIALDLSCRDSQRKDQT